MTASYNLSLLGSNYNQGGTGAVARTTASKLQESVSVKDFGAVGDGTTDDTAAFTAAAAASPNGATIPPATYKITGSVTGLFYSLGKVAIVGGGSVATISDGRNSNMKWVLLPTAAPTVAVNATAGNLNGTYYYSVSFVSPYGETDGSPPSAGVSPVNQQVNLTAIQTSTDSSVTARNIYRTPVGAADQVLSKFVATINDNTTTTYTDNMLDASLGVAVPRSNTTGGNIFLNGALVASFGWLTTKIGYGAAPGTTGYANVAIGSNSLYANTTGYRNTFIGVDAGRNNTTGYGNTGIGTHANDLNVTGNSNTAIGLYALESNLTNYNTAVGSTAMQSTTTGGSNTAIGTFAMQLNTTGSNNAAIGYQALYAMNGAGNVAIGAGAASSYTSGNFNVHIGQSAGGSATSGSTNTSIGLQSLYNNLTGGGNVALGGQAGYYETGNNHLWIDNQPRASLADAKLKALLYGTFDITGDKQQLTVNGQLNAPWGLGVAVATAITTNYAVLASDTVITCNGAGTITLTMLTGTNFVGKVIIIRNTAAFTVVSASSNVIPQAGGAAGTAILAATAGKWAYLQFDGTNYTILMSN